MSRRSRERRRAIRRFWVLLHAGKNPLRMVFHPPKRRHCMSGTNVTNIGSFTLQLPNVAGFNPGFTTFPIAISNSDGSAPSLVADNPAVLETSVGPMNDNEGAISYEGTITALSDGSSNVTLTADGIAQLVMTFGVINVTPEGAVVNAADVQSGIVAPTLIPTTPSGTQTSASTSGTNTLSTGAAPANNTASNASAAPAAPAANTGPAPTPAS